MINTSVHLESRGRTTFRDQDDVPILKLNVTFHTPEVFRLSSMNPFATEVCDNKIGQAVR